MVAIFLLFIMAGLSVRVPKCQKLTTADQACMTKCNNLRSWVLKCEFNGEFAEVNISDFFIHIY